jgi:hypothetical protein
MINLAITLIYRPLFCLKFLSVLSEICRHKLRLGLNYSVEGVRALSLQSETHETSSFSNKMSWIHHKSLSSSKRLKALIILGWSLGVCVGFDDEHVRRCTGWMLQGTDSGLRADLFTCLKVSEDRVGRIIHAQFDASSWFFRCNLQFAMGFPN